MLSVNRPEQTGNYMEQFCSLCIKVLSYVRLLLHKTAPTDVGSYDRSKVYYQEGFISLYYSLYSLHHSVLGRQLSVLPAHCSPYNRVQVV